jgi:hypothetical protein
MKKIYFLLFAFLSIGQINSQVLNQNAGWPNAAWTITGSYETAATAFEANPTTTANFAFDDDDALVGHEDNIAAESPAIDLTAAFTAGEQKVRVSALYGYYFLADDVLRFEYWNADTAAWVVWSGNIPGNYTIGTITDLFCTIPKTLFTSPDLDISAFTPTQLSGFKYRIYYNDSLTGVDWNYGFCFNSPTIISVPTPCLTGINYPTGTLTLSVCDGLTSTEVASDSYAGDYFNVAVTSGQTYTFGSSVATDFFTISADNNVTSVASGTQPLTWVATTTGTINVHINTNITCGTEAANRTTSVTCGVVCLNGTLYPFDTYTPDTCDGTTVNVVATDSYAGEYSNINVFSSNTYTFSSSIATDYITVANESGTVALLAGTESVVFTPNTDGVVRVYFHTNNTCGNQNTNRERRIVCTSSATVPDCAINPTPANGATVPAFTPFTVSWEPATTGLPAVSYDVYSGDSLATLAFELNQTDTFIPDVQIDQYGFTLYWQIIAINAAGEAVGCTVWSFTTSAQPTDTPDFVNLQFPPSILITQGGSGTVYGKVYEAGLTDSTSGQAPGILAWVGISPIASNTDPATWTNWIPATFNVEIGNDDEYQAVIGANLTPGDYFYATRFTLNDGPFVYGGLNNGFWNAATNPSGIITVNPPVAPANNECTSAIALTAGGVYSDNITNGTNLGATASSQADPAACDTFANGYAGGDVWFSVVVPASGSITIETGNSTTGGTGVDTVVVMYTGIDCGSLTQIECDDDSAATGAYSLQALTGLTAGSTLYLRVYEYGNNNAGTFGISAYDGSLATNSFDNANFTYYPNPVKNVLNLSYTQDITSVSVFNLLGQEMLTKSINATQSTIDMSNMLSGAYFVKVTADNQTKTIKVIKE